MFDYADKGSRAGTAEQDNDLRSAVQQEYFAEVQRTSGLGTRTTDDLFRDTTKQSNDNLYGIDLEKDSKKIADFLNQGRSDLAVSLLSKDLTKLSGEAYNQLLLKVSQNEDPEFDGDQNGHLLLSDWNNNHKTWSQVFVQERDQLYRIVQPGNTLPIIAADRLGSGASADSIKRYVKNICDTNSLPAAELVVRGQALKLPYPN